MRTSESLIGCLLSLMMFIMSCTNELTPASYSLDGINTSRITIKIGTLSTKGGDINEKLLNDIVLLAYKSGNTVPEKHLYCDGDEDVQLNLRNGIWRFLLIGNLHHDIEDVSLASVENMTFDMNSLDTSQGLPLALDETVEIDGDETISLSLRQMLSRHDIQVTLPNSLSGIEIRSVQIRNVNRYGAYFAKESLSVEKTVQPSVNQLPGTRTVSVISYLPPQYLGVSSSITSEKQRTLSNSPGGAAYLEVCARRQSDGVFFTYQVPIGGKDLNDFDFLPGSAYETNLQISDVESGDSREQYCNISVSDDFVKGSFADANGTYYTSMDDAFLHVESNDENLKNGKMDLKLKLIKGDKESFHVNGQTGKELYEFSDIQLTNGKLAIPIDYHPTLFTNANGDLSLEISIWYEDTPLCEMTREYSFYNHLGVYCGNQTETNVGGCVSPISSVISFSSTIGSVDIVHREGTIAVEAIPDSNHLSGSWRNGPSASSPPIVSGSALSYTFTSTQASVYHNFIPK